MPQVRTVHIQGMGLNGALLATLLHRHDVQFTWSDNDHPHTAWKACTGAIYPSGSTKFGPDEACRAVWARWASLPNSPFRGCLEPAYWVFNHKKPPHDGKYPTDNIGHGLSMADPRSYHFNAQAFVEATRGFFKTCRRDGGLGLFKDALIISHAGKRLGHSYWGWTRYVRLSVNFPTGTTNRCAFYFRKGRYVMAYAYPVPGTPWWYAGSSIIKQRVGHQRSLTLDLKYEKWKKNFEELGGGAVKVVEEGPMFEGWRPAARAEDTDWVTVEDDPGGFPIIRLRPLWNSGVRHFPKQWTMVADALGIEIPQQERVT